LDENGEPLNSAAEEEHNKVEDFNREPKPRPRPDVRTMPRRDYSGF